MAEVVAAAGVGDPWERAEQVRVGDPAAIEAMSAGFAAAAEHSRIAVRQANQADPLTAASYLVDRVPAHDAPAATAATVAALGAGGEHPELISRSLRGVAAELTGARDGVQAALGRLAAELAALSGPSTVPIAAVAAAERALFDAAVAAVRRHGRTINTLVEDYDAVLAGHTRLVNELAGPPGSEEANPPPPEDDPPTVLEGEGELSATEALGLLLDLIGIFDPTPISDGLGALASLGQGDLLGAAISLAAAAAPFGGDVLKISKLQKVLQKFPHLAKYVDDIPRLADLVQTLKHVNIDDPSSLNRALGKLNGLARDAGKQYAKRPQVAAKVKSLGLPTDGPIPFVPPKGWDPNNPPRVQGGFKDAYGNVWTKDRSKNWDEWDVTLPNKKGNGFEQLSKDGTHLNVDPNGVVTH